jgi:tRNA-Thr(GGU) m(6)t(6)A37 methyltransferase TsaA
MKTISLLPVAIVSNSRKEISDDYWGTIVSEISLNPEFPEEAFAGIEQFSHLEIIYYFDQLEEMPYVISGHPRGNPQFPLTGIFAQRKKDRPNHIGLCAVELVAHHGRTITVRNLDALDGTPVLDIKPVMKEFQPRGEIRQPSWVSELMKDYWR